MKTMTGLVSVCVTPVAAVACLMAICGVLILSLTTELHEQFRPSVRG